MPSYSYTVGTKSGKRIGTVIGYGKNRATAQRNISRMLGRRINVNPKRTGYYEVVFKGGGRGRFAQRVGPFKTKQDAKRAMAEGRNKP